MRISDWSADVCSSDLPIRAAIIGRELDRYEQERARYSQLIFTHEMREVAGDRFETIRDVARFLIEGMAFAAAYTHVAPERKAGVTAFMVMQMKAASRGGCTVRPCPDRKSAVTEQSVSVRVERGGSPIIKKKN